MVAVKEFATTSTNDTVAHASTPTSDAPRQPGWGKGIITYIAHDFDEPLEDFNWSGATPLNSPSAKPV